MVNSFQSRNDYTNISLLQSMSVSPLLPNLRYVCFLLAEGENLNDENLHNPGRGTEKEKLRTLWYFSSDLESVKVLVAQVCLILCDPMDCSPPGSSVHRILQARTLEWVAIPFSRGSSRPRDWTWVSCIAGRFFTVWVTREALVVFLQWLRRALHIKLCWISLCFGLDRERVDYKQQTLN